MTSKEFRHFKPEKVLIPETEKGGLPSEGTQIIHDQDGRIAFCGSPHDVAQWVNARRDEGATFRTEEGGVLLPGLADTHYHPAIYGTLELLRPADASAVKSAGQLRNLAQEALRERKGETHSDEPLVILNYDSSQVGSFSELNMDEVEATQPIFVLDRSFHSGAGNSAAMRVLDRYLEKNYSQRKQKSGAYDFPGYMKKQEIAEAFVFLAMELAESYQSVEKVEGAIETSVENYLAKGVTSIHEMAVMSWQQLMAYLLLHKEWKGKHPKMEFPVRQIYLTDAVVERFVREEDALVKSGLLTDDIKGILGVKLLADGSIGSRTALMDEPYLSADQKKQHGIIYNRMREAEKALKLAARSGLDKVAVHAIGDKGIVRAIEFGRKWMEIAEKGKIDPKFRMEHFELPQPESIREAGEMGAWVSMQPNFGLEDIVYHDRIGNRTRLLCPHADLTNEGVPMMFGSDGMPDSMLYVIWSAMHHHDPKHRLDAISAVTAASAAAGAYEGSLRGTLQPGSQTDIVVASPELLQVLADGRLAQDYFEQADLPPDQRTIPIRDQVGELERRILRVFRNGQLVHAADSEKDGKSS
ncbi:MAG: amidohydrolase family protein [Candidatus Kerfeldbacteria bacterium]